MKMLFTVVLSLVAIIVLAGVLAYALGAREPLDHTASVTGTVDASPARVFALITNISAAPAWRKEVKSVQILPPGDGPTGPQDHWIETLGHNSTMTFLATRTVPPNPSGNALREVLLDVPGAAYGGTWTYKLSPGPTPTQTILQITETGFIKPPIYRFMMAHLFGMTRNLDQYLREIQAEAARP